MILDERQLLEDAARAAGNSYPWYEAHGGQMHAWNPLNDDGDALRLAVKLHLDVNTGEGNSSASWYPHRNCDISEPHDGDPGAATRRAIVRAAAAIGQQMKEQQP